MKKRILVVDDEKTILNVIKRLMKRNGYEVQGCATSVEATDFIRMHFPDLIIADFNLSELGNGVDLALSIRWSAEQEIPIIIMSGSPHTLQKARTNRFGFIEKPIDNRKLVALVEKSFHES